MGTWEDYVSLDESAQLARGLEVMREVVAEVGPGYVYGQCRYVDYEGTVRKPGCLIGRVLNRLGLPLETMEEIDNGTCIYNPISGTRPEWVRGVHPSALLAFKAAQEVQDERRAGEANDWTTALEAAEKVAARLTV